MKRLLAILALLFSTAAAAQDGQWSATALSTLNTPLGGYTVTVYDYGTTDLATLYSDAEATAQDNPFLTASDGTYSFWADAGDYRIIITATGKPEWGPYQTVDLTVGAGTAEEKAVGGGTQTAAEVDYTPADASKWVDPDPALVSTGLDDLAARLTTEEAKVAGVGGSTGAVDNTILRADGAGGATVQDSNMLISDPAASIVTLSSTAGNSLTVLAGSSLNGSTSILKLEAGSNTTGADFRIGSNGAFVGLHVGAYDVWQFRRGTVGQTFKLFRTYTDSSNYERLALQSGSGYFEIAAETAGTGTDNLNLNLTPAGTGQVLVGTKGINTGPAIANSTDTDTGLYWHANDNRILVTNGGTATWIFGASGELAQAANTAGRPYLSGGSSPPVYTFNADTDTGMYRSGADAIAFYIGGSDGLTLSRSAGNALTAPPPAATTGASQVGRPITITASNAVASTDTVSKAAGGDVTITAGNAAVFGAGGNQAGGSINLNVGTGVGSGGYGAVAIANGQLRIGSGTSSLPSIALNSAGLTGFYNQSKGWCFTVNGNADYFCIGQELVMKQQSFTCADSGGAGAADCTLTPTSSYIETTCSDADGCNVTWSETGATQGVPYTVINIGANVVNFADTAGVTETSGALALGEWDAVTFLYAADRFVQTSPVQDN